MDGGRCGLKKKQSSFLLLHSAEMILMNIMKIMQLSSLWPLFQAEDIQSVLPALFVAEAAAEALMTTESDGCWLSVSVLLTSCTRFRLLQQLHDE